MRLATIRTGAGTKAVRLDDDVLVDVGAPDVGALLDHADWAERAAAAVGPAATYPAGGADYAPVVPRPSKVICVGLNHRSHILEMGRPLPEHPTLFAKFADALIGARDDIAPPGETSELDWEAELALIVGAPVRRARGAAAAQAIAGFTVLNDITCRDWQFRPASGCRAGRGTPACLSDRTWRPRTSFPAASARAWTCGWTWTVR